MFVGIVDVQRDLLRKVNGRQDISDMPQTWVMYKEVQGFYQEGVSGLSRLRRT